MQIFEPALIALSIVVSFGAVAMAQDSAPDLSIYMENVPACLASADPQACIGQGADRCMTEIEGGGSTQGMTVCIHAEEVAWDALMAARYSAALATAAEADVLEAEEGLIDVSRVAEVTASQTAWIAFRDANCTMHYGKWGNGTMRFIAGAECEMQMTAERTIELSAY